MERPYCVASLSGGGVRGIITTLILAELEKRAGKPISKLFDLIAGSSIGGISALLLTAPKAHGSDIPKYSAWEAAQLIINKADNIFSEPLHEELLGIVDDLLSPKYPSFGRETVIKEYLADIRLDEALTNVFITSYDTALRIPVFFTSDPSKEKNGLNFRKICQGILMRDVAMATSAAPSYFEPYKLDEYCLIDGGMFANNPTALAMIEAELETRGKDRQKILCSVGTGSMTRRYEYNTIRKWGLLNWLEPIINIIQDAQSQAIGCQLEEALPSNYTYFKFDGFLTEADDDLDNTTHRNIELLSKEADKIIKHNDQQLDEMCKLLVN